MTPGMPSACQHNTCGKVDCHNRLTSLHCFCCWQHTWKSVSKPSIWAAMAAELGRDPLRSRSALMGRDMLLLVDPGRDPEARPDRTAAAAAPPPDSCPGVCCPLLPAMGASSSAPSASGSWLPSSSSAVAGTRQHCQVMPLNGGPPRYQALNQLCFKPCFAGLTLDRADCSCSHGIQ